MSLPNQEEIENSLNLLGELTHLNLNNLLKNNKKEKFQQKKGKGDAIFTLLYSTFLFEWKRNATVCRSDMENILKPLSNYLQTRVIKPISVYIKNYENSKSADSQCTNPTQLAAIYLKSALLLNILQSHATQYSIFEFAAARNDDDNDSKPIKSLIKHKYNRLIDDSRISNWLSAVLSLNTVNHDNKKQQKKKMRKQQEIVKTQLDNLAKLNTLFFSSFSSANQNLQPPRNIDLIELIWRLARINFSDIDEENEEGESDNENDFSSLLFEVDWSHKTEEDRWQTIDEVTDGEEKSHQNTAHADNKKCAANQLVTIATIQHITGQLEAFATKKHNNENDKEYKEYDEVYESATRIWIQFFAQSAAPNHASNSSSSLSTSSSALHFVPTLYLHEMLSVRWECVRHPVRTVLNCIELLLAYQRLFHAALLQSPAIFIEPMCRMLEVLLFLHAKQQQQYQQHQQQKDKAELEQEFQDHIQLVCKAISKVGHLWDVVLRRPAHSASNSRARGGGNADPIKVFKRLMIVPLDRLSNCLASLQSDVDPVVARQLQQSCVNLWLDVARHDQFAVNRLLNSLPNAAFLNRAIELWKAANLAAATGTTS